MRADAPAFRMLRGEAPEFYLAGVAAGHDLPGDEEDWGDDLDEHDGSTPVWRAKLAFRREPVGQLSPPGAADG